MKPPKLSGPLREKALILAENPDLIIDRAYSAIVNLDDGYSGLNPVVKRDVMESIRLSARLWFKSILEGTFPAADELEILRASGRRRVHQGLPLTSLLRAFRLGSREMWQVFLELGEDDEALRNELLFVLSPYLLDHFDLMAQSIAQAYLEEEHQRTRWRDALRYELCSIVFSSPDDVDAFKKAAEALGIDGSGLRVAITIDIHMPDVAPSGLEAELDRFTLSVSRHFKTAYNDLVRAAYHGHLIIWVPCARGDSLIAADRRLLKHASSLLETSSQVRAIGVGLMNAGPAGWATSANESIKALELGNRSAGGKRAHLYSDIAVSESVRRADNALRYLDSLIERLSHESDLLMTLEVYFEQSQRRKATAAALGIHPNTLTYRLERVEALLGAKLEDVGWMMKLHIAMRLRRGSMPT
ncbi:MAG TPA: helix-turn-helix domain-containing protein, partial [Dokdonella sp.]